MGRILFETYSASLDESCPYTLGRMGSRPLFVVGLNPSVATREASDTTVTKVINAAALGGFDGFVMLNLYPLRSTDPQKLPYAIDATLLRENVDAIDSVVGNCTQPNVWAAWGNTITVRPFLMQCAMSIGQALQGRGALWLQHGTLTTEGHPRHPSRLAYADKFEPFDMGHYLSRLRG